MLQPSGSEVSLLISLSLQVKKKHSDPLPKTLRLKNYKSIALLERKDNVLVAPSNWASLILALTTPKLTPKVVEVAEVQARKVVVCKSLCDFDSRGP